jgi:hypothetical protein
VAFPSAAGAPVEPGGQAQSGSSWPAAAQAPAGVPPSSQVSDDIDGARLIALNMALNGESRAETDRYLAENYQLADRQKLIDEVFAAIEG